MKRFFLPLACVLAIGMLLFAGCDDVNPTIRGTPTPSASPTPLPPAYTPQLTAEPMPTDAMGNIVNTSDHYFDLYISFGDLRVYEYDTGTFLDGICVNAYPTALDGELNIVYYTKEGKVCGIGKIHNAQGGTSLETGSNAIYAEISTDIDVRSMDFNWVIVRDFSPVTETPKP